MAPVSVPITPKTAGRYLVGRTITAVSVESVTGKTGRPSHHVSALTLDDGTRILLSVEELEGEYAVVMTRYRGGHQ